MNVIYSNNSRSKTKSAPTIYQRHQENVSYANLLSVNCNCLVKTASTADCITLLSTIRRRYRFFSRLVISQKKGPISHKKPRLLRHLKKRPLLIIRIAHMVLEPSSDRRIYANVCVDSMSLSQLISLRCIIYSTG